MDGKTITRGILEGSSLDVRSLEKGTYIIKISNKNDLRYSKFVKIDP
jgi:hypothetical protein